jgi:hypothetical protein
MFQQNQNKSNHPFCRSTLIHHFPYRFYASSSIYHLHVLCFNLLPQLPQSLSPKVGPSTPPSQSVLVESSPVAPPSFDQWQQQQQPSYPSAAVEDSFLSKEMARKRAGESFVSQNRSPLVTLHGAEDEFTNDLREAQREVDRGGMANDVVRDTRDALIKRGEKLQVTGDRRRALFILTRHTLTECS